MDKETIQKRIEELKKENDRSNERIVLLDQERNSLIQEMFVRNGRILELTELSKEE